MERYSLELPLTFLFLFALSGNTAVMGKRVVVSNIPCASVATLEQHELMLKAMATMLESLQALVAQAAESKISYLDILELETKIDILIQKEEKTEKYIEQTFDNMSKKLQEMELQQKDSKNLEMIASSVSDSTGALLSALNENAERLQKETSEILTTFSKETKDNLKDMEIKMSQEIEAAEKNIREVNDILTEMEIEAKKKEADFSGMIKNVQQKVESELIPTVAEMSKQLSHVDESTTSAKSSCDETQNLISSSVSSIVKEVKEMATEIGNLEKEVADNINTLQGMENKLFTSVTTIGEDILTAVTNAESEIGIKLNEAVSEDKNDMKDIIHDSCGLMSMSGPSNCAEIQRSGQNTSGIYTIVVSTLPLQVFCDMETDGGGWTVFQRRDDVISHIDFFRYWADYKRGFGDLSKEFWLGLDSIYALTSLQSMSLRVDLEDFEGNKKFAFYQLFSIGDEWEKYRLSIEDYQGDAGDDLMYHNGHAFSTRDKDNDASSAHCAQMYYGAWWYQDCHASNLNGKYLRGEHSSYANGVNWHSWKGNYYSLKKTEMKIRPIDF